VAHDLTLWGAGTSRTMRAHWMLQELGLEYEFHRVKSRTGETQTEEFLKLNPRHKIPVLRHKSLVVTESAAIIQYLSEVWRKPAEIYVPVTAAERAAHSEWCYFILSELDAASLNLVRRHDGLRHIYGEAPTAVAAAKAYFTHNLAAMTAGVATANEYLLGNRLSTADILLMTCLDWAVSCELPLPEWFQDYQRRVARRPAYKAALKRNFAE
jgi:glutathione S-transferase